MLQSRRGLPVVLSALVMLGLGQLAWAADPSCKEARKHFRKSIWWFESDRWDRSVDEAEMALEKARGCDPEELAFVVPYGRWRYDFNPEVYLGVAAANSSWCEGERIEDKKCLVEVPLWEAPEPCERDYVRRQGRVCTVEGDDRRCDPEVDWWLRLARVGVGLELDRSTAEVGLRLARDRGSDDRRLNDECAELWSIAPFLAEAILRRENRRRVACETLVHELTDLLGEVRGSCEAGD